MKKIITIVALLFVSLAVQAQYAYVPLPASSMPATLATTASTNLANPPVIDVTKQSTVALQFSFNQSGDSTSNVVYTLQTSIDRTTWDTTRTFVISIPSTGTTRVDAITNLNVNGIGYLRLYSISNATALTTMTNFGVQYAVKVNQ